MEKERQKTLIKNIAAKAHRAVSFLLCLFTNPATTAATRDGKNTRKPSIPAPTFTLMTFQHPDLEEYAKMPVLQVLHLLCVHQRIHCI